ncbi:hypothetical protein VMCG_01942 [Cytospora schulzeri]|uniref:Uncharacterized protein n=1 Tax=Cytospora schulzeri TaxID=448051 RepID=A0A423X340_9PEZI|nr:hypothetical protein VMCG_01942 [Valsa malicola]
MRDWESRIPNAPRTSALPATRLPALGRFILLPEFAVLRGTHRLIRCCVGWNLEGATTPPSTTSPTPGEADDDDNGTGTGHGPHLKHKHQPSRDNTVTAASTTKGAAHGAAPGEVTTSIIIIIIAGGGGGWDDILPQDGSHGSNTNNNNNNHPNWAYGPNGWHNPPWRYGNGLGGGNTGYHPTTNLEPGGTIEEIEEGRTGTAPVPIPAPVPAAILTTNSSDQDAQQHNHYHPNDGHDHGHRRRRRGHRQRGRHQQQQQQRRDGFLGLMDRERDREMDRHMINQDALNAREGRTLALLDRERDRDRDRDRGDTAVVMMDLLGRELNRRRGLRPGRDADGGEDDDLDGVGERRGGGGGEGGGGLRREIEALRKDLSMLTTGRKGKASKKSKRRKNKNSGAGTERGRGHDAASRSPRGDTSAAVGNNNITFSGQTDTDDQDSEENENEGEDGHGSDDDGSLPSDWGDLVKALAQDVKHKAGRDPRPEHVDAERKHETRALHHRRRRDDLLDTEDVALVREDELGIDLDGRVVLHEAFLHLEGVRVTAHDPAGLEDVARDAVDAVGIGEIRK